MAGGIADRLDVLDPWCRDVLQETMMRAWHNIEGPNPDPGRLRPWLLTVARRISIDRLRDRTHPYEELIA